MVSFQHTSTKPLNVALSILFVGKLNVVLLSLFMLQSTTWCINLYFLLSPWLEFFFLSFVIGVYIGWTDGCPWKSFGWSGWRRIQAPCRFGNGYGLMSYRFYYVSILQCFLTWYVMLLPVGVSYWFDMPLILMFLQLLGMLLLIISWLTIIWLVLSMVRIIKLNLGL